MAYSNGMWQHTGSWHIARSAHIAHSKFYNPLGVLSLCLAFGGIIRAFGFMATALVGPNPHPVGSYPPRSLPDPLLVGSRHAFRGVTPTFGRVKGLTK
jgi:hypothetical protein